MNIEEARKVLWLRTNPKPLGKLMDEGYLTQERLEWAAKWAYSPNLQQAAKVLLETQKHPAVEKKVEPITAPIKTGEKPVSISISLEKARATTWPFAPYKGQPMGILVDSKQLSLKDLVYAVENAWDEKVRQAAVALSLLRLNQAVKEPVPSAGFVQVVSGGRSFSEQKQLWLMLLEGIVLGLMLSIMIFLLVWSRNELLRPHPNAKPLSDLFSSPVQIIAVVVVIGFGLLSAWLVTYVPDQIVKRLDKQIEEHRLGQEGEDRAVQLIVQALDGNWHLFRNVGLPGRNKGDLDLVMVGPPGVWVLEVKNLRGEYRNIGESWEYQRGKSWKAAAANPGRQAQNNALRLKNFLRADGLNVFVNGAVVWANPENTPFVENPSTAVWSLDRLPDELGNIWQGEKLSEVERKKIVEKLSKLCERQRQSHQ